MATALSAAEQALLSGDEDKLYEALKAMGIQNLQVQNKGWYLKQLQGDRENKDQVGTECKNKLYLFQENGAASLSPRYNLNLISFLLGISRRSPD